MVDEVDHFPEWSVASGTGCCESLVPRGGKGVLPLDIPCPV